MKIVFISNFLNHHTIYLSRSLKELFDDFCFIATEKKENEGFQMVEEEDFVMHYYDSSETESIQKKVMEADVAIIGICPEQLIRIRVSTGKLTFMYSERFFKRGLIYALYPRIRKEFINRFTQYKNNENFYVLCSSAYLPKELKLFGFPISRCIKWGYFPEMESLDVLDIIHNKETAPISILWAGRFIDWKHPDDAIRMAKKLKEKSINFQLIMIGKGEMENKLKRMVDIMDLNNVVKFIGSLTPEDVRNKMKRSSIFISTSDQQEGWGVVINEAMNSACAVVASNLMGSVPYLIRNGENGFVYKSGCVCELVDIVTKLINNKELRDNASIEAYKTIVDEWNPYNAALSFYNLVESVLNCNTIPKSKGVCSLSDIY